MSFRFIINRLFIFFLTILSAVSLNFIIMKITPQDPVAVLLGRMASRGSLVEGGEQLIKLYRAQFGLDDPLYLQYWNYISNLLLRGDLGYSLSYFPAKVESVILPAIPWTIGLFVAANLISFTIGNILGAIAVWPKVQKYIKYLIYFIMPLSAIPFYLMALLLLYLMAIKFHILPIGGTFRVGSVRGFDLDTMLQLLEHAALPLMSISIGLIGFWALSMRGIMAVLLGEDFLTYARAKGLRESRIFLRYGMRNALLPQVTALSIDLGLMISGQVLVETIFNYPGVGSVLFKALRTADYFVIQGVVLFIVVAVAFATLVIDIIYPLLDSRIRYKV